MQVCEATGLRAVELQKRHQPALWRAPKKAPESVRDLPSTPRGLPVANLTADVALGP